MATSFSDSLRSPESMTIQSGNIKKEIAFLVGGLQTEDKEQQSQITSRLLAIAQNECPQASYSLLLYPLFTLLLNGNIDASSAAQLAIITLVNSSDDVRSALIKIGFIETARQVLNVLFQGVNANEMIGLVSILSQLSEEKSEEKKKIAQKAKMILNLLSGFGITGSSSSNNVQLEQVNEELKIQIEEQQRNNNELQRKDQEKQRIIDEKNILISELQRKDEENKQVDEENKRKIADLERQLADSKSKPIINNKTISQPKSDEIPISITVPSGSYSKKEGEFTYTSTKDSEKIFPIDKQITEGIFKLEFKINKLERLLYIGVMKSGPSVPFDKCPNDYPYRKNCMYFNFKGCIYSNGKETHGNQRMKEGDIIELEVNMDIVQRTVRLFINGVLQPVYMSGIPDSIQFFFNLYYKENSVTVLSLKRLYSPTNATVTGAIEMKWE